MGRVVSSRSILWSPHGSGPRIMCQTAPTPLRRAGLAYWAEVRPPPMMRMLVCRPAVIRGLTTLSGNSRILHGKADLQRKCLTSGWSACNGYTAGLGDGDDHDRRVSNPLD